MKAKLTQLLNYIIDNNITCVKTKAGTGLCFYKLEQIASHREAIEGMATACEWQLSYFSGLDKHSGVQKSQPKYYLGPVVSNEASSNDILGLAKQS